MNKDQRSNFFSNLSSSTIANIVGGIIVAAILAWWHFGNSSDTNDMRPKKPDTIKVYGPGPEVISKGQVGGTADKSGRVKRTVIADPGEPPSTGGLKPTVPVTNKAVANYSVFVNHSAKIADIAIVIASDGDMNGQIASQIGTLYEEQGHSTTTSQFTSAFVNSDAFKGLEHAESSVIDQLNLPATLKYVVLGTYSNQIEDGSNNGGYTKYVSRGKLKISIVSCERKSQLNSFSINVANGYDDKDNAEAGAIEKILKDYKVNHLNL